MNKKTPRDQVVEVLQATAIPFLRQKGFAGSMPHFRRIVANRVDLLTFQFSAWSYGTFCVELSQCGVDGYMRCRRRNEYVGNLAV
jgi:hypothetical protein